MINAERLTPEKNDQALFTSLVSWLSSLENWFLLKKSSGRKTHKNKRGKQGREGKQPDKGYGKGERKKPRRNSRRS